MGTGMGQTDAHSSSCSLGSSVGCCQKTTATQTWDGTDTSPDAQPEYSADMNQGWEKPRIWPKRKIEKRGFYFRFSEGIVSGKQLIASQ